jgi:polyferredoxin
VANRKIVLTGIIIAAVAAVIWLMYYALIFVLPPMAGGIFAWSPNDSLLLLFFIGLVIAAIGYFLPG